jgi:phosphoglycolate phosphatase-like HAD superfamily hydrolase
VHRPVGAETGMMRRMPSRVDGKKYLNEALAEIKRRTLAGEKVAVGFDVDNTLVDTRGRALAIGKKFDALNGTTYFKGKTAKQLGNDARETAALVKMSPEHTKKFSALFFREFFKGENYKNDTAMRATVSLAKKAAAAGADVFYLTARTQSEEQHTIEQLKKAGLPADAVTVVSKPKMKDKTPEYKAAELGKLAGQYDFVPWFITESKKDIAGVQKLNAPVKSVLLETKFSGTGKVDEQTPIWKYDVK